MVSARSAAMLGITMRVRCATDRTRQSTIRAQSAASLAMIFSIMPVAFAAQWSMRQPSTRARFVRQPVTVVCTIASFAARFIRSASILARLVVVQATRLMILIAALASRMTMMRLATSAPTVVELAMSRSARALRRLR